MAGQWVPVGAGDVVERDAEAGADPAVHPAEPGIAALVEELLVEPGR
jgi:hypothetical protein